MKYVLIFALVVVIAQIDVVMKLVEKSASVFTRQKDKITGPAPSEIKRTTEVVPYNDDPTLKMTPHAKVLSLMESFKLSPEPEVRVKILEDMKVIPKMISTPLDKQMETRVFEWRDLLIHGNEQVLIFLVELQNLLQGENQEMIRRFFSLLMDQDLDLFMKHYVKTKDVNCKIVTVFGDQIPEEEKINEYQARMDALTIFLAKENLDPAMKQLATNCQLFLKAHMDNLNAPPVAPQTMTTPTLTTPVTPVPAQPAPTKP
jgi:hypothetical protein